MTSKFRGILDQAKGREPEPVEPSGGPAPIPAPVPPPAAENPPALPSEAPPRKGPGRPKGKRTDPSFDQVTAYVPHELYRRVRLALLEDDQGQEFSELVADLLSAWLANRPRG